MLCSINIQVKRIGGGFGGKISRPSHIAAACAVAAQTLKKPVRVFLDLETNMSMLGKRLPYIMRYEVRLTYPNPSEFCLLNL
jgi:xanthine dehydrogenase/oxidase